MSTDKKDVLPSPVRSTEMDEFERFYDVSRLDRMNHNPRRANNAAQDVFDLIGGVPRMAVWADKNPGEFYTKIYNKTMQSHQQQEHSGEIRIISAVPRTAIDGEYTDVSLGEPVDEGHDRHPAPVEKGTSGS